MLHLNYLVKEGDAEGRESHGHICPYPALGIRSSLVARRLDSSGSVDAVVGMNRYVRACITQSRGFSDRPGGWEG